MSEICLSEGAIEKLSKLPIDAVPVDLKPVLQVTDIRLVTSKNQGGPSDRYRLMLSDGLFLQQGMISTQMNGLIMAGTIQKGSIIRLNQFSCNDIQNKRIIIIIELDIILENCDPIGDPKNYPIADPKNQFVNPSGPGPRPAASLQSSTNLSGAVSGNLQSFAAGSLNSHSAPRPPYMPGGVQSPEANRTIGYNSTSGGNIDSGRYSSTTAPLYPKTESGPAISRAPMNNHVWPSQPSYVQPHQSSYQQQPHHSSYQQRPSMYANRGPPPKNEAPPRIIPIALLNLYQCRWTIKARVTAKAELRRYSNTKGDGKVFSFDLLDADRGEIRVTCFNTVAEKFYDNIEPGSVYLISKGSLRPAQKSYNHLPNDHEIMLDSTSVVQHVEDDGTIPQMQFHFRPISHIEAMGNNSVVDVIGVVFSISPSSSIMRKDNVETQKRVLQLKDMSGKSVELTLWGKFCNAEGQRLQVMCDSGAFPVLAVKAGRVNDYNGKSIGTISTSMLFIEPDFPEAQELNAWFEREGKDMSSISLSREMIGRTDVRKAISQIKEEKLGTSEKPDWITVSATVTFVKSDNFCYPACPLKFQDRPCNKKMTNNGDGTWRCDRCDKSVDDCEYRYILQLQIQDHTGVTWVSAFQECGDQIMGVSAKELYLLNESGDDRFAEIFRNVVLNKNIFKLKVKEEVYNDERRVKSTVVKAEKVNFQSETRFVLGMIDKMNGQESSSLPCKTENVTASSGFNNAGSGSRMRGPMTPVTNYGGSSSSMSRESGLQHTGSQFGPTGATGPMMPVTNYGGSTSSLSRESGVLHTGSQFAPTGATGCNSCGGTGHTASNCPSTMSGQSQSQAYGGGIGNRASPGGRASDKCFKCNEFGHWAINCPNAPLNTAGRYGNIPRQHAGGF